MTAEQLAGGGVRCEWPTNSVSSGGSGGTIAADLRIIGGPDGGGRSVTMAAASGVDEIASSAPVGEGRFNTNARGGGAESEGGDRASDHLSSAFAWDPALLAYDCPLFARKFPEATAAAVYEVLADCRYNLRVLPSGRAEAGACAQESPSLGGG